MLNMWEISKSLLSLIVAPHGFVCFSSEPSKEEIITHCCIYMVLVGMYLKVFMWICVCVWCVGFLVCNFIGETYCFSSILFPLEWWDVGDFVWDKRSITSSTTLEKMFWRNQLTTIWTQSWHHCYDLSWRRNCSPCRQVQSQNCPRSRGTMASTSNTISSQATPKSID